MGLEEKEERGGDESPIEIVFPVRHASSLWDSGLGGICSCPLQVNYLVSSVPWCRQLSCSELPSVTPSAPFPIFIPGIKLPTKHLPFATSRSLVLRAGINNRAKAGRESWVRGRGLYLGPVDPTPPYALARPLSPPRRGPGGCLVRTLSYSSSWRKK